MNRSHRWLWVLCLSCLIAAMAPAAERGLRAKDFVAVCGDSITEQKLYSVFIEDYLLMCQPAAQLRAMQAGWGGETAPGFLARMDRDVLLLHPTVVTTCYGMNDGGYRPLDADRARRYRETQKAIVRGLKKAEVRLIVLGSPGCVDSDTFRTDPDTAAMYNKALSQLRDIDRELAAEEDVAFADVHGAMMDVMGKLKAKYGRSYHLAGGDGIHPAPNGHLVMAYAFLKAMGCDGTIGTITMDLSAGTAQATEGHKVLSGGKGSVELESSRYPFCFYGQPDSPSSTCGVLEFLPFNQDLNRFVLVVQGAAAQTQYDVTWGSQTKRFSGAELTKGINLAAEFLDNPFGGAFKKVEQAVQTQQNYETPLTKVLLHNMPLMKEEAGPEDAAAVERITARLLARDQSLARAASSAVVPVKHTIKVSPAQ